MERTDAHFGEQLEELSQRILRLGGMVEKAIGDSVRALIERDSILAQAVIDGDSIIDAMELEIDRLCLEMLALNQPMARDLRFITTAMKITPDLERIADHAANISERAIELNQEPPLEAALDIPLMANCAQRMVRGAMDAFVREDADGAREVIRMDDDLDRRMEQVFRVMLFHMMEKPSTITRALRVTFVAKYFERIGDQATNMCEQIVFMTEAKVIKHTADEDRR